MAASFGCARALCSRHWAPSVDRLPFNLLLLLLCSLSVHSLPISLCPDQLRPGWSAIRASLFGERRRRRGERGRYLHDESHSVAAAAAVFGCYTCSLYRLICLHWPNIQNICAFVWQQRSPQRRWWCWWWMNQKMNRWQAAFGEVNTMARCPVWRCFFHQRREREYNSVIASTPSAHLRALTTAVASKRWGALVHHW